MLVDGKKQVLLCLSMIPRQGSAGNFVKSQSTISNIHVKEGRQQRSRLGLSGDVFNSRLLHAGCAGRAVGRTEDRRAGT